MEEKIEIKISDIVSKLNDDELKTLCDEYGVNTANFDRLLSKGIYKNNLKKKIIKAVGGKEAINRHTFSKYFVPKLTNETITKIYPQYNDYITHIQEKKQRKLNKELKAIHEGELKKSVEIDDKYNNAYADYYNANPEQVKETVDSIKAERERIQEEEAQRRKQAQEAFYNKLIEERNNELTNLNNDKIDNSPFTDKINSIKAAVERQLRKLRELEHQEREWKSEQLEQAKINNEYENAYNDFYMLPSEQQIYNDSFTC